jgi:hypothetical protein
VQRNINKKYGAVSHNFLSLLCEVSNQMTLRWALLKTVFDKIALFSPRLQHEAQEELKDIFL